MVAWWLARSSNDTPRLCSMGSSLGYVRQDLFLSASRPTETYVYRDGDLQGPSQLPPMLWHFSKIDAGEHRQNKMTYANTS